MNPHILELISSLVESGEVWGILGWARGTYGLVCRIQLFRSSQQLRELVLPPLSYPNPVSALKFLIKEGKIKSGSKLGILVKGCDSKSLNQLIIEGQISRDQLVIIGIRCPGVIDPKKLDLEHPEISLTQSQDGFLISIGSQSKIHPRDQILAKRCLSCRNPEPVIYDLIWGDPVAPRAEDYSDVLEVQDKDMLDRWRFWSENFGRCIRCHACRNICPLCYCESCVLETTKPQWIFRSNKLQENVVYHIIRAYHLAGRCAGCGECERACPMDIPLTLINRKLEMEVRKLFDHEPGITPRNLLAVAKPQELEDVGY